jgi:hypothetical protein
MHNLLLEDKNNDARRGDHQDINRQPLYPLTNEIGSNIASSIPMSAAASIIVSAIRAPAMTACRNAA